MAELVDALDSKSCDSNIVRVRFPLWALRMSFYGILFLLNAQYKVVEWHFCQI